MTASLDAVGPDPDERARIRGVLRTPSRLDVATVAHLTQGLYGQRHAEDDVALDASDAAAALLDLDIAVQCR